MQERNKNDCVTESKDPKDYCKEEDEIKKKKIYEFRRKNDGRNIFTEGRK